MMAGKGEHNKYVIVFTKRLPTTHDTWHKWISDTEFVVHEREKSWNLLTLLELVGHVCWGSCVSSGWCGLNWPR